MSNIYYSNQGATRNQHISPELAQALSFLPELGLTMEVFSGGQPGINEGGARVGSTRHDHGGAADAFFYKDGRKLDWANPDDLPYFSEIVKRGREAGITGFGAGDNYMQPGSMHIGFGKEAVWGAGGKGENAPDWLRSAYNGAPTQQPATGQHRTDPNYAGVNMSDGMAAIMGILGQTPEQQPYKTGQHRTDPNYAGTSMADGMSGILAGIAQSQAPTAQPKPQTIQQAFSRNALAPRTQKQDPRNFLNKMSFGA